MSFNLRVPTAHRALAVVLLPLTVTASLAGCYSAVPIAPGATPAEGARITVHLTPSGTARVEPVFGPFIVSLDGSREAVAGGDSIAVRVTRTHHQAGMDETRSGDLVRLARADVERIDGRKLSKGRTGLAALIVVAVAALIPSVAGSSGGSGPQGGPIIQP
jgi:hypothetical protein